jgi:hypothetical protein
VKRGSRDFVDDTRERYKGVVSSIRHQFQLMKPENLTKITNELDGEDYDLNAVVDFFIDRRADGQQSERIYTNACAGVAMSPSRFSWINPHLPRARLAAIRCSLTHIPPAHHRKSKRKGWF